MSSLRYNAGHDVHLGDTVRWGAEALGTVVVMIAEQTAIPGYNASEWSYLGHGCMLHVSGAGLFHYDAATLDNDPNLVLLKRAGHP